MGCGATKVEADEDTSSTDNVKDENKEHVKSKEHSQGNPKNDNISNGHIVNGNSSEDTKREANEDKSNEAPVPKAVAFDITFDSNIENILKKNAPKRLSKLEPLANAPKLTSEMLSEKQRQADEKREQELNRKRELSRKSSKLRKQLIEAKELDKAQETTREIEEKQRSAGKIRDAKRLEMLEKKRIRIERANQARERARQTQTAEQGLDIDVEKDETYNAEDDVDSWLEGENNNNNVDSDAGDRIYSGRESPRKQYNIRSSAEMRARASAFSTSTSDSFDYAFQREPVTVLEANNKRDDFFDT